MTLECLPLLFICDETILGERDPAPHATILIVGKHPSSKTRHARIV